MSLGGGGEILWYDLLLFSYFSLTSTEKERVPGHV